MDLLKAKIFLDKINREFARMNQDPENILRIDIDIMQSYVREFYDACLSEPSPVARPIQPAPEPAPVRKPVAPVPEPPAPSQAVPSTPEVVHAPVPPAAPAPPPAAPPAVTPPQTPVSTPPVENKPSPAPPSAPQEMFTPAPPPPAHKTHHHNVGVESLFEQKEARELVEKLSEQPIQDLRRAIALNDRLLYTRELFGNDNQQFENAISVLNNCTHFDEAKHFLIEQCVHTFGWTDKKKADTAKSFIKLTRRRFK